MGGLAAALDGVEWVSQLSKFWPSGFMKKDKMRQENNGIRVGAGLISLKVFSDGPWVGPFELEFLDWFYMQILNLGRHDMDHLSGRAMFISLPLNMHEL